MLMNTGVVAYLVMKKGLFIRNRETRRRGMDTALWSLANRGRIRYNTLTRSISPYSEAHPIIL